MKFGTLQVYPRQGLLQEHGLDLPSAVIGRGEGSNIHIDDFSVSRRHARLTVEAGRLLVEDLGSVGGTFVDGERLEPGVRHLIEEGAVLRFGEIEAHYLPPVAVEATPAVIDEGTEIVSAGGLSIALVSPEAPIEAGRQATATLVVTNRGRLVDNVRVELPDLPPEWYTVDAPAFPILPGGRADVKISLHPPRRHDALAGDYAYTVAVRSQEYDEHPETQGSFQILPFESAAIAFEAVRSKHNFRILAENRGNEAAQYELSGAEFRCVVSSLCGTETSDFATLTICPGDLNCDGFVNGDDYDAFASAFEAGDLAADFNHDGFVNGDDYDAFASAFEAGC